MTATSPSTQCTRNRQKDGQRCTLPRVTWWAPDLPDPQSCHGHLTADERDAYRTAKAARSVEYDRMWAALSLPETPVCHSWPAPEEADEPAFENEWIRSNPYVREGLRLLHKMQKWQAGRCPICGCDGASVEDHCHRSGLFRGFLCRSCNTREGRSHAMIFEAYRRQPPAVIVGYTYQYVGFGTPETGAEPEDWIAAALGPLPPDHTQEAVVYLTAAAALTPPLVRVLNLGW